MNLVGPDKHKNVSGSEVFIFFNFRNLCRTSFPVTKIRTERGLIKMAEFLGKKEIMHNYLDVYVIAGTILSPRPDSSCYYAGENFQQFVILLWRPGPARMTSN